jgi:hypothetical protein
MRVESLMNVVPFSATHPYLYYDTRLEACILLWMPCPFLLKVVLYNPHMISTTLEGREATTSERESGERERVEKERWI